MIQRIQTLYLLAVAGLMTLMLSFPLGRFLAGDQEFVLKAFGLYQTTADTAAVVALPYMGILIAMAALLPLVTVFFYKNRILQIRLCFMEMVFALGVQAFVLFYFYRTSRGLAAVGETATTYSALDIFPILCLILTWLAFRAIARDEALVRSLNRIR